jgi:hypothetical protein
MENFTTGTNESATLLASGRTTAGLVATPFLLAAIFGSCPTVYSDSGGVPTLEAETFSHSIAPLFERRDVDRLRAQPDTHGVLSLEVRNEALETHYINHLALLEATHAPDELIVPDGENHTLAVRGLVRPDVLVDRAGRNLRPLLAGDHRRVFRTEPRTLARVTAADPNDYIDLAAAVPPGADSVAIVFELRNSLLNTVLLYDHMLGGQGPRSLDYVGRDLATISRAIELGRWYGARMGVHVAVWRAGRYEKVAYVPDAGPIAWRRVAAVVPARPGDTLRVRLSFVADQWRIRSIAVAPRIRRLEPRTIPLAEVLDARGAPDNAATENLRDSDARYLATGPGQRFTVRFRVDPAAPGTARTFLLASQGYYIEWIRHDWLRVARHTQPFTPSDSTLLLALHEWRTVQHDFEHRFESARIPVR